jgi:hypothetical protein
VARLARSAACLALAAGLCLGSPAAWAQDYGGAAPAEAAGKEEPK